MIHAIVLQIGHFVTPGEVSSQGQDCLSFYRWGSPKPPSAWPRLHTPACESSWCRRCAARAFATCTHGSSHLGVPRSTDISTFASSPPGGLARRRRARFQHLAMSPKQLASSLLRWGEAAAALRVARSSVANRAAWQRRRSHPAAVTLRPATLVAGSGWQWYVALFVNERGRSTRRQFQPFSDLLRATAEEEFRGVVQEGALHCCQVPPSLLFAAQEPRPDAVQRPHRILGERVLVDAQRPSPVAHIAAKDEREVGTQISACQEHWDAPAGDSVIDTARGDRVSADMDAESPRPHVSRIVCPLGVA